MTRIVRATKAQHHLSVGPLRSTPVGRYSTDQLESAKHLVAASLKELEHVDDTSKARLEADLQAVEDELERRSVELGAA